MKQAIESPNEDELSWIAENLELAQKIIGVYAGQTEVTLDSLDATVIEWNSREESNRIAPNDLVNALGIAFGQLLITGLGLAWAIVSDEQGTELAVHGKPFDTLVFPTAAVGKRIAEREGPFFRVLYEQLSDNIAGLRRRVH